MNIEKVDSNFLFTVDCENPRWPPLTKNVILANEDVIEKDLPYNMSIFNSYTTSQYWANNGAMNFQVFILNFVLIIAGSAKMQHLDTHRF